MIGVFDSGFGGLTVLRGLLEKLPEYDYLYLGDNARVPYGNRSEKFIFAMTQEAVDYLFRQNCLLIILACHTASAQALRKIQQEYLPKNYPRHRVLGVIRPVVEVAAELTTGGRIGLIGTEATVRSQSFIRELKKLNPKIEIFQQSAPLLVPIIEAGEKDWSGTGLILRKYLKPLLDKNIDTLILACTHYPILKDKIRKIIGSTIQIVSSDEIVPEKLADYLIRHPEIANQLSKNSKRLYLTTDFDNHFQKLASFFLGQPIRPKLIEL